MSAPVQKVSAALVRAPVFSTDDPRRAYWHPTRNGKLTPDQVVSSAQLVWWLCPEPGCAHEWKSTVSVRRPSSLCGKCARRETGRKNKAIALRKHGSILDLYPALAAEFRPELNPGKDLASIAVSSTETVTWSCSVCPETWTLEARARLRALREGRATKPSSCPACANQVVRPWNCLAARNPELAREWHPLLNGPLSPEQVVPGHTRRVWWLGPCGHAWQAQPLKRSAGQGCAACHQGTRSLVEIGLECELETVLPVAASQRIVEDPEGRSIVCDVVVPSMDLVVEYDGFYTHAERPDLDAKRTQRLEGLGWRVVRLRSPELPLLRPDDLAAPQNPTPYQLASSVLAHILTALPPAAARAARAYLAAGEPQALEETQLRQLRYRRRLGTAERLKQLASTSPSADALLAEQIFGADPDVMSRSDILAAYAKGTPVAAIALRAGFDPRVVREILVAAGVFRGTARLRSMKLSDEEIRNRAEEGATIAHIAQECQVSYSTMVQELAKLGVSCERPSQLRYKSGQEPEAVRALYDTGLTLQEVCEKTGIKSVKTVGERIKAAGGTLRPRGAKRVEYDVESWRVLYENGGWTGPRIAEHAGVSVDTVRERLTELGVELKAGPARKALAESGELVRLYIEELLTCDEIAERYDTTQVTISKRLREAGVELRPSRFRPESVALDATETVRLYCEEKLPVEEVARKTGASRQAVKDSLATAGVALRGKGGIPGSKSTADTRPDESGPE